MVVLFVQCCVLLSIAPMAIALLINKRATAGGTNPLRVVGSMLGMTALMMGLSLVVSLFAPGLRTKFGLGAILLLAFGMQIGLTGALAVFGSVFAIALLLLRMVPDSLSTPFIEAHLQPLLGDESRATFLSIKSLAGRLLFAASLWIASLNTAQIGEMPLGDIQMILSWYAVIGLAVFAALLVALLRVRL